MEHPEEGDLLRFLLGTTSRQENRAIVRHLLTRCPSCAVELRRIKPDPPVDPGAYDEALARAMVLASASEGGRRGGTPASGSFTRRRDSG